MIRSLLIAFAFIFTAIPAHAERLATAVSRNEVSITSSFDGDTLTLFGNIEPDIGSDTRVLDETYHIIIVVTGPLQNRVARKKSNVLGIWINTKQVTFESIPAYYQVVSDARIADIIDPVTVGELGILPEQLARTAARSGWWDSIVYGQELVRLLMEEGLYGIKEQGVVFRSNTLYSAQINLESNAPPGAYLAHTYLIKDGAVITERTEGFSVRKSGFERFLGLAAVQQPLLYGISAVILALFTGWLGGAVFRR